MFTLFKTADSGRRITVLINKVFLKNHRFVLIMDTLFSIAGYHHM